MPKGLGRPFNRDERTNAFSAVAPAAKAATRSADLKFQLRQKKASSNALGAVRAVNRDMAATASKIRGSMFDTGGMKRATRRLAEPSMDELADREHPTRRRR